MSQPHAEEESLQLCPVQTDIQADIQVAQLPNIEADESPNIEVTETDLVLVQQQLAKARVVYQDNYNGTNRIKPFILTPEGILYLGTTIAVDQAELDELKAVNTIYGAFCLYPVPAPQWVFISMGSLRRQLAQNHPIPTPAESTSGLVPAAAAVLDLPLEFTLNELKTAYRKAARKHHPDWGGDAEQFIQVSVAYELMLQMIQPQQDVLLDCSLEVNS